MRKRILSVILIIGIMASLGACGIDRAGKKKEKPVMETVSAESEINDVEKTEETAEPALADNGASCIIQV